MNTCTHPIERVALPTRRTWLKAGAGGGSVLSEVLVLSAGLVLSESGQLGVSSANDSSLLGEP